MNLWKLVCRSLAFHWRSHAGLFFGTLVASAILCGALVVGDSMRGTLLDRARHRTAGAVAAIHATDRYFRQDLAARLVGDATQPLGESRAVAALALPATVRRQDNRTSANHVQAIGIRGVEWQQFLRRNSPASFQPQAQQVWFNEALAARLKPSRGDTFILRVPKPSALSQDAVITPRNGASVALRLAYAGTVNPASGGDITFQAGQSAPLNAFVNLDELAKAAGLEGRANWLLVSDPAAKGGALAKLTERLERVWTLNDLEMTIRPVQAGNENWAELVSRRIFLDEDTVQAAAKLKLLGLGQPQFILTYLANGLAAGGHLTPYSMVAAAGPPYTPADLGTNEMVVTDWLGADLQVSPGSTVALTHYRVDAGTQLQERTNLFRVRSIVPLAGLYADRALMPDFPGLAKAESTHDWDAGFELIHPVRSKDEAYWKERRGTPKAYISLAAGTNLWANRFGNLTSVRWPVEQSAAALAPLLQEALRIKIHPGEQGLKFDPIAETAAASAQGSQDFGELFGYFSFFLIVSALCLVSLLFRLALMGRAEEWGILLASGWQPRQVTCLMLREALLSAGAGAAAGTAGGLAYGQLIISGLNTIWQDATAGAALEFHATAMSLAGGAAGSLLIVLLTVWLLARKAARRPAREVLQEGLPDHLPASGKPKSKIWRLAAVAIIATGALMAGISSALPESQRAGLCFGGGFLLLVGMLWEFRNRLFKTHAHKPSSTFTALAARAPVRNPGRSVSTAGLLASAAFLIVAVGAFRQSTPADATQRPSGTGGFTLWGESSLPVIQDLNSAKGRDFYTLDAAKVAGMEVVPMKVQEGDEASCLNLNLPRQPRLLGVDPGSLASRKAFTFTESLSHGDTAPDWNSALRPSAGRTVRGVADASSLEWSLHKQVGETIACVDEAGRPFEVLIVAAIAPSILQGSVVIAESDFTRLFPGNGGYKAFLIDCPPAKAGEAAGELTRSLVDLGFEAIPTTSRLAAFNAVENTYLNTFQMLGGLGLLLGSAGMGIVVLRNVAERRAEFAVLRAMGYTSSAIRRMVLLEHGALLVIGLAFGTLASVVAVLPSLLAPGPKAGWLPLAATMAAILACGLICTWFGARRAVAGGITEALRGE